MTEAQSSDAQTRHEQALAVRAKILGPAWDEGSRVSPGLARFTELGIQNIWNGTWVEPDLELRMRSTITISALVAIRMHGLLRVHVAGALRERLLSAAELRALVLHLNPYVGYRPHARRW
jgi:alkylhydroperoxidase/carboxymuconolactone decarboxylase family protein YurZ